MAITHPTLVRTALATAIQTRIDAGPAGGLLEIKNSGGAVLSTITLNDPCGTVANGEVTFNVSPLPRDAAGDANGTAALFSVKDSTGVEVYSGTISAVGGGGDLEMISTTIVTGLPVELTSMVYSASP